MESPQPFGDPHRVDGGARIRVRLWPAWLILALGLAGLGYCRWAPDWPFQTRNLRSAAIIVSCLAALGLWLLAFSRLPWRRRLLCFGILVAVLALPASFLRFNGVSGDLLPEFSWRWSPARQAPPPPTSRSVDTGSSLAAGAAPPHSFPQFRGAARDGRISGPPLATNWSAQVPTQLWRSPIGAGWSGFAVAAPLAITQEQAGDQECITALNLFSGQIQWRACADGRYFTPIAGEGPRATPTVHERRVFAFGATGRLTCLDLVDGRRLWETDLRSELDAPAPDWGFSSSPLVVGERVVVSVGGRDRRSLAAVRIQDGVLDWASGSGPVGYSSPLLAAFHGIPQILIFNDREVSSHAVSNGAVLWKHPWKGGHPHVAVPLVLSGERMLVSSGYGTGSQGVMVQHSEGAWSTHVEWTTTRFRCKFSNPILLAGYAYGLDDGILACLETSSGALMWKEGRYGHGQVLLVNELLLVTAEDGRVLLFQPIPRAPVLLTQFKPLSGKCWNPPALAGDLLLVRNAEEAACYRLPLLDK